MMEPDLMQGPQMQTALWPVIEIDIWTEGATVLSSWTAATRADLWWWLDYVAVDMN